MASAFFSPERRWDMCVEQHRANTVVECVEGALGFAVLWRCVGGKKAGMQCHES